MKKRMQRLFTVMLIISMIMSMMSASAFAEELKALDPELIFVAAYGKILPSYVLEYPKYGCINVHGSLLPKYRGAAPMQRAIIDGE